MLKLKQSRQRGFTIVELVVVIIILGILAATALPRFLSIEDDAYSAVVDGVRGSFIAGVSMARAKWKAAGSPVDTIAFDLDGDGADDSLLTSGWITGTDQDSADCRHVLNILVSAGVSDLTIHADETTYSVSIKGSLQGEDITTASWYAIPTTDVVGADCTMAYVPEGGAVGDPYFYFTYNRGTGAVSDTAAGVF